LNADSAWPAVFLSRPAFGRADRPESARRKAFNPALRYWRVVCPQGELRATCPYRFHEGLDVFHWVGDTILGDGNPTLVGEVGFLEASATTDAEGGDDVGASTWYSSITNR